MGDFSGQKSGKKTILRLDKCKIIKKNKSQPKPENQNWKIECDGKIFYVQPLIESKKAILQELIGSKVARSILGDHRVDDVHLMKRKDNSLMCASQQIPDFTNTRVREDLTGFIKSNYNFDLPAAFVPVNKNSPINPKFTFAPNNKEVKAFEDLFITEAFVNHKGAHVANVGVIEPKDSENVETAILDFDRTDLKSTQLQPSKGLWNAYKSSLNLCKLIISINKILDLDVSTLISQVFKEHFYDNDIFKIDEDLKAKEESIIKAFRERQKNLVYVKNRLLAAKDIISNPHADTESILKKAGLSSMSQDILRDVMGINYYSMKDFVSIFKHQHVDLSNDAACSALDDSGTLPGSTNDSDLTDFN